jgi:NAD(P)-dependent dehydrogenase (short-subunit alcohol dehydrogenase family)
VNYDFSHLNQTRVALIVGASSEIAKAITQKLAQQSIHVMLVSRTKIEKGPNCTSIQSDYSEHQIETLFKALKAAKVYLRYIFILNGTLHTSEFMPEKALASINEHQFLTSMRTNALIPILWIKHAMTIVPKTERSDIVCFSARVGSIGDNGLGGWYSYRSSKAALNMLMKTASIEYKRTKPKCKLTAFHPGTTSSPLSQPFQKNVSKDKLFTAGFVADALFKELSQLKTDGQLSYIDWQGKEISW